MRKVLKYLRNRVAYKHVFAWLLIGIFDFLVDSISYGLLKGILVAVAFVFACMLVYYILLLFVFPKYWNKNPTLLATSTFGIYLVFSSYEYLYSLSGIKPSLHNLPYLLQDSLFLTGLVWFGSLSSFLNRRAHAKIKALDEKDRALLAQNINGLKSEFVLGRTSEFLDFIRKETFMNDKVVTKSVELFSNIIQYTTEVKANEPVPLKMEIFYISSYIQLYRCLHPGTFVDFQYSEDVSSRFIYSRILMTFVENALKHGITNSEILPIRVSLELSEESIVFCMENEIDKTKRNEISGLGLQQVNTLLNLYYPNKHELKITVGQLIYSVRLVLFN
jgi:two-component system LytT family sensor kinase